MAPWTERVRYATRLALPVVVGLVGAWLGGALFAPAEVRTGPFRVAVRPALGRGVTDLGLPPFGRVVADTHVGPLDLSATLTDVGVRRLTEVVGRVGIQGLVDQVQADALDAVPRLALRLLLAAVVGAGMLGALVFRRRLRAVGAACLTALVAVGGLEALAWVTYRPAAFTEPRYVGSLGTASHLIGPVREATDRIEDFRVGLQALIASATRAYTSIQAQPLPGAGSVRVLHVSDLHASPLGMDFAREVADAFEVDLVVDTGDLTSFGTPLEDLITARIAAFGRPYVFVRGNHDSLALQAEVARLPNAIVLDGNVAEVAGLRIYGLGHPAFTPSGTEEGIDPEAFEEEARGAAEAIREDLARLEEPPDIVAVHDDRMVEDLAGEIPLVVSGHFHRTTARVIRGTLFLRVGTTGGNGAGVFRGLDVPLSAEVLYFSRPESRLIAYDVIEQDPETGSLSVTRHLISRDYGELVLTPSASVIPPLTVTPG
ncbi:3',5'-cyclic adenosine monophosphate phosphodiesterase CpdA [bacterium HR12]|nr:3',5'-cyclic adenosine monophosphate phosphodiesterase CpdA [bacterium HR12]